MRTINKIYLMKDVISVDVSDGQDKAILSIDTDVCHHFVTLSDKECRAFARYLYEAADRLKNDDIKAPGLMGQGIRRHD